MSGPAATLASELERERLDDLKAVAASPAGRRFLLWLLGPEMADLEGPNAEATDHLRGVREGQRSLGHRLKNRLKLEIFEQYLLAEAEAIAERRRRHELMKLAK